ncbi:hypothetical protein ACQEVB_03400 [Pseudonocardia sp. CA-107938]|uniref:hypothetical protein n=1 Tax=Pseudonocardia sp. CA-107938 TaxID=3240021 RepID=UPI003D91E6F9
MTDGPWQWSTNVPRGTSTWCHACEGKGAVLMPRMGMADGEAIPTAQMQECRVCDGSGRLAGFQAPV